MPRAYSLAAIGDAIRAKLNPNPADISAIMGKVAEKLDESNYRRGHAREARAPHRFVEDQLSQRCVTGSKNRNTRTPTWNNSKLPSAPNSTS